MGDRLRLVKVSWPDHHQQLVNGLWNFFLMKQRVDFPVEWGGIPLCAHQLILEVFLTPEILERKPFLNDVKRRNLDSLLEFLYKGEAVVRREELDSMERMAEKLGFKMLADAVEMARGSSRPKRKAKGSAKKRLQSDGPAANLEERSSMNEWVGVIDALRTGCQDDGPAAKRRTPPEGVGDDTASDAGTAEEEEDDDDNYKPKSPLSAKLESARRSRLYRQKLPLVKCGLCDYQTRERRYYGNHMAKYHPGEPVITCPLCKTVFFDQETLDRHMSKRHMAAGSDSNTTILGLDIEANSLSASETPTAKTRTTKTGAADAATDDTNATADKSDSITMSERKRQYRLSRPLVKCPLCDYKTGEQRYYTNHLKRHHPQVPIPTCDLCQQTFFNEEALARHKAKPNLLVHSAEYVRPQRVTRPVLVRNSEGELVEQPLAKSERANRPQPKFDCDLCDYTTTLKLAFTNHRIVQHPGLSFLRCDTCKFVFPDDKALAIHRQKNAGGECGAVSNRCQHCTYETPMRFKMYRHMYVRHGVNAKGEAVAHRYRCGECDFAALLPSHLKRHELEKHSGLKPYQCQRCSFASSTRTSVYNHVRKVHLKIKPFLCATCGKPCSSNHELQRHHRVHTGERPYPCSYCGLAFADNYTLTGHVRSKHCDAKPFVCHVCAHAFKRQDNLRVHLRKVHQNH